MPSLYRSNRGHSWCRHDYAPQNVRIKMMIDNSDDSSNRIIIMLITEDCVEDSDNALSVL